MTIRTPSRSVQTNGVRTAIFAPIVPRMLGTSLAFAASQLILIAIIASGAGENEDRTAGVLSLLVAVLLALVISNLPRTLVVAQLLVIGATMIAPIVVAGLLPHYLKGPVAEIIGRSGEPRLQFPIVVHPNTFAYVFVPAPAAAFAYALASAGGLRRVCWTVIASVGTFFVAVTGSRTSILALTFAAGLIIWLRFIPRQRRAMPVATLAVLSVIGLLAVAWAVSQPTVDSRFALWSRSLQSLQSSPLLGIGYGVSGHLEGEATHNTVLQVLVDFGVAGGCALGVVLWLAVKRASAGLRSGSADTHILAMSVCAALVALGVASLSESVFESPTAWASGIVTVVSPVPLVIAAIAMRIRSVDPLDHPSSDSAGAAQ